MEPCFVCFLFVFLCLGTKRNFCFRIQKSAARFTWYDVKLLMIALQGGYLMHDGGGKVFINPVGI